MSQVQIPQDSGSRRDYVKGLFNSIAGTYDLLNTLLSFRMDVLWRRKTVKIANVPPGGFVLDLCTGTGKLAFDFAGRSQASQVIGTDFSQDMVAKALDLKKTLPVPSRQKIIFFQGDALRIPFKENTFDAISCAFGIRNVVDLKGYFSETFRVSKVGGILLTLELTRPSNRLVRIGYYPYLHFYLPLIGRWVSGNPFAYEYLAKTITEFVSPGDILALMEKQGWKKCQAIPLTGGIATLFVGIK